MAQIVYVGPLDEIYVDAGANSKVYIKDVVADCDTSLKAELLAAHPDQWQDPDVEGWTPPTVETLPEG